MNGCPEEYQDKCEYRERDCYCRHPNVGDVVRLSTGKDCCPRIDEAVFLSDYNEIKAAPIEKSKIVDSTEDALPVFKDNEFDDGCAGRIGRAVKVESDGTVWMALGDLAYDDLKYKAAKYDELKILLEWEKVSYEAENWLWEIHNDDLWLVNMERERTKINYKDCKDVSNFLRNMIE